MSTLGCLRGCVIERVVENFDVAIAESDNVSWLVQLNCLVEFGEFVEIWYCISGEAIM